MTTNIGIIEKRLIKSGFSIDKSDEKYYLIATKETELYNIKIRYYKATFDIHLTINQTLLVRQFKQLTSELDKIRRIFK